MGGNRLLIDGPCVRVPSGVYLSVREQTYKVTKPGPTPHNSLRLPCACRSDSRYRLSPTTRRGRKGQYGWGGISTIRLSSPRYTINPGPLPSRPGDTTFRSRGVSKEKVKAVTVYRPSISGLG